MGEPVQQRPDHRAPYERIRDAIVEGELQPGEPLVELALARRCGVSRTPVREALRRLEQDGLVRRGDRGMVVRDRSPEEILDLYEVRILLEAGAARTAAERHTAYDRIRLQQLARACEVIPVEDMEGMVATNRAFHRGIWDASHNETIQDLLDRLNLHLVRYPATTLSDDGRWERSLQQHRDLVTAITEREGDRAAALATEHFTEARDIRLRLWEQSLADG